MKTYENESAFVNNFAKDAKESLRNGQNFEATVNNAVIVVSGMDNNNSSKVTLYTATINGVAFSGSITALKKKLNVTFKKEYNRNSEAAKSAKTVVAIKSDEELQKTAENENVRFINAVITVMRTARKYSFVELLSLDNLANIERDGILVDSNDETVSTIECILDTLKVQRDAAKREAEEREAARREAEEERTKQRNALMAELAEASAQQNFGRVMELSKLLAQFK